MVDQCKFLAVPTQLFFGKFLPMAHRLLLLARTVLSAGEEKKLLGSSNIIFLLLKHRKCFFKAKQKGRQNHISDIFKLFTICIANDVHIFNTKIVLV